MASEWARLTRHAKRVVMESQEMAASLAGDRVLPEHLFMAILDDPGSTGLLLLTLARVPVEDLRLLLEERLVESEPGDFTEAKPSFSPELRQVVVGAGRIAGEGSIGTEHLVLAMIEPEDLLGEEMRQNCSIDSAEIRRHLANLEGHELGSRSGPGQPPAAAPAGRANVSANVSATAPSRAAESQPVSPPSAAPAVVYSSRNSTERGGSLSSGKAHVLLALARLVVDLAGKASQAARQNGNDAVARQIDGMRAEVEAQMQLARPASDLSDPGARKIAESQETGTA